MPVLVEREGYRRLHRHGRAGGPGFRLRVTALLREGNGGVSGVEGVAGRREASLAELLVDGAREAEGAWVPSG